MSGAASKAPRVSVRNLTKVYHTRRGEQIALSNVSLDVVDGEMLVLLGPSGCGKTTLLRCVAGLEHPTSGQITVHGRTMYSSAQDQFVPPEQRNLSMVFQSYALWPHMSVAQNVGYPLKVSKVAAAELAERVHQVLLLTGLEKYAASYPGQLSGGQQQRVALARALVANDGLILFDEPLSNLDAKVRERLREELISMQQQFGFTALYVTHDQTEAAALAHRIAVMEVGQIAQLGTSMEVYNAPINPYVADFVGCSNELSGTVIGRAGERWQIDTPIGPLLGTAASATLQAGQTVRVMFRPEHCRVVAAGGSSPNAFEAKRVRSVFLGTHVEHRITVADTALLLRSMHGGWPTVDQAVHIAIDPECARVYPAH